MSTWNCRCKTPEDCDKENQVTSFVQPMGNTVNIICKNEEMSCLFCDKMYNQWDNHFLNGDCTVKFKRVDK